MIFSIFGTMYFRGKFFYCNFSNIMGFLDTSQVITKWDCLNCGGEWRFYDINFDNVPMAFIALFNLCTTEGWATVMWRGVDAVDIDMVPQHNNSVGWAFFFILFMLIGSEFVLNLFISIVVNSYYSEKDKLYRNDFLTKY